MELILGSQSPRRRELLERMGLRFRVLTAEIDETKYETEDPVDSVCRICRAKAEAVAARLAAAPDGARHLVLTADTIVVLDGRIMGKPRDRAEACAMLAALSGREHAVYTAFTLLPEGGEALTRCEKTLVRFRPLSAEEIAAYADTGEPMDKAGAYGIQGRGSMLVEAIQGDYFTVVGLPVCRLACALRHFDIDPLKQTVKE